MILVGVHAEADRIVAATEAQRDRGRELLTGALASLDVEHAAPPQGLVADLESRLHETAEPSAT